MSPICHQDRCRWDVLPAARRVYKLVAMGDLRLGQDGGGIYHNIALGQSDRHIHAVALFGQSPFDRFAFTLRFMSK